MKFRDQIEEAMQKLRELGHEPLFPNLDGELPDGELTMERKKALALDHYDAIEKSDAVYFILPDGYMGTSCKLELGYSLALKKPIYFSEPTGDIGLDCYPEAIRGLGELSNDWVVEGDPYLYANKCELCADNYLLLERSYFDFLDKVYAHDDWEGKKNISTMELAHQLNAICAGIEETFKLLLQNPNNDLTQEFIEHLQGIEPAPQRVGEIIRELNQGNFDRVKIQWILNFKSFKEKLNTFSAHIKYPRKTSCYHFTDLFEGCGFKPSWYQAHENIKHNFFSKYQEATIDVILNALAAYYLLTKVLVHEAIFIVNPEFQGGHYPWYEARVNIFTGQMIGAPKNYIAKFDSDHFETLSFWPDR